MNMPPGVADVFLRPGEFHFGGGRTRIRTVLGSCVAIALWHPGRLIGGMCHYMLPQGAGNPASMLDGRYADGAFRLLLREIVGNGTRPAEYQARLLGGGCMLPFLGCGGTRHIGRRNAEAGRMLLDRHGLAWRVEDLGGIGYRSVVFELWSGQFWLRRRLRAPCR